MIKKIIDAIKRHYKILLKLDEKRIITLPDKRYLKYRGLNYGMNLDIDNPKTFNEKLQWLKLNDRNTLYTKMVDKYEAKEYVKNIIGEEYIIPTLGIYDKFDDIDFNKLPNQFVIKCTHDSASIMICHNKNNFDIDICKKKINSSLKVNYYYGGREYPYKNVKPRIIIEKYMEDKDSKELRDYKFFCFNGVVKYFKIDFDRFTKHGANYYNEKKELVTLGEVVCPPDFNKVLELPHNIDKMMELASKLSSNIPFLRVDFYEVNKKIYFGELTFYPASGYGKFTEEKWDTELGNLIDLSKVKMNEK